MIRAWLESRRRQAEAWGAGLKGRCETKEEWYEASKRCWERNRLVTALPKVGR